VDGAAAEVVARSVTLLPDSKAPDLYPGRLEVLTVGAVVADEGIGGQHYLPSVGRVGEHLLVSCHAGIKYHLAVGVRLGAKGEALIDRAVFQY